MNAETKEMRMMILASIPSGILRSYLISESTVNVNDHACFPGETISFTPSKEELEQALDSAKFMKEADSIVKWRPRKALKLYNEAFIKNPYDPLLLMSIGVCEHRMWKRAKAIEILKKAYDLAPDRYYEKQRIKRNLDAIM